jgi:DNA polymerase-3 subunit gamma/tau
LSILDQAIAHAGLEGGGVRPRRCARCSACRTAARSALFGLLLTGDAVGALAALRGQYDLGVDPQAVLRTLLETVHGVTLAKLGTEPTAGQSAEELKALEDWAAGLSFAGAAPAVAIAAARA